jgi:hypothetical protein
MRNENLTRSGSVVNMPRCGCYSQARIAVQLDRYQKDSEGFRRIQVESESAWWADTRQTGEFHLSICNEAGPPFPR